VPTGVSPLDAVLADGSVTEVLLNGPGRAFVERGGRLEPLALDLDEAGLRAVVERVIAPLGLRLDRSSPMVDARLPDGSRLHAVMAPVAVEGTCVAIRRFGAPCHSAHTGCWTVSTSTIRLFPRRPMHTFSTTTNAKPNNSNFRASLSKTTTRS